MIIDRVFWDFWESAGGDTNGGVLKYYRNPTITGGTDITPTNTNFGSVKEAEGTFKKNLASVTGSVWWTAYVSPLSSVALEEGRIVLPKNASFAISVEAPTGNTSLDHSINVAFYYLDEDLIQ